MVVKDNKETSFEREASIAEIHWLPLDARIATIAEIENFSVSNARIAGNATIAGKQDKKTFASFARSGHAFLSECENIIFAGLS